jgi:hypothetical protein
MVSPCVTRASTTILQAMGQYRNDPQLKFRAWRDLFSQNRSLFGAKWNLLPLLSCTRFCASNSSSLFSILQSCAGSRGVLGLCATQPEKAYGEGDLGIARERRPHPILFLSREIWERIFLGSKQAREYEMDKVSYRGLG